MNTDPGTITVVHIISVAYSGSTWLNLLLGSHSRAVSGGELKRLVVEGKPVCAVHAADCPLWSRFDTASQENPFLQIARLAGSDVIVVNNSRKLRPQQQHPRIRVKWINLIRDGRAVTASYIRKHEGAGMWRAARWWAHDIRRNRRLMRRQDPADRTEVIYERALEDTEGELRRLCDFIGLGYEPPMLNYWEHDHHYIGGNRGTLFAMLRKRDARTEPQRVLADGNKLNWDLEYYKTADADRFRDERWRKELTRRQLTLFTLLAGGLNRRLGY